MGSQPGEEPGTGEEPDPDPGALGGSGGSDDAGSFGGSAGEPSRDARLAGFAAGGEWDTAAPSADLAAVLEAVSGPQWRCAGAERDELLGMARRWAALESWAAAGKLGVLRALIRDDEDPLSCAGYHGDLPDGWSRSLTHQVSLALAMPPVSAEHLIQRAWSLEARLPGIGRLLANGTLTSAKAKTIEDALSSLMDEDAAKAEAMILPDLAGKTYGQADKLAVQAAITVDPGSAARRREDAERNRATVIMKRGRSGAANLSGYDLPTADALAAHAGLCARAQEYKDSQEFPDVRIDQLRAQAYLDLLNGISAADRIAIGQPDAGLGAPFNAGDPAADDSADSNCPCAECDGSCWPLGNDGTDDGTDDDGGDGGPGPYPGDGRTDRPGDPPAAPLPLPPRPSSPPPTRPSAPPPKPSDLVIPLATLLGLAWRPGESHDIGPLDPDLCRALAAIAANDPRSMPCVTVTDDHGYAIAHGCGRPARTGSRAMPAGSRVRDLAALPARVNLTITSDLLAQLAQRASPEATGPPGSSRCTKPGLWSFTRTGDPGPPGGHGTWQLTLPDGRFLTVKLEPVPTFDCDHGRESHAYKPNDALRHLVQVRDYQCTFPTCSRHASDSDFEHAIPYDRGGRTCGCNAGARSRQCHQVKQSPGWNVTQPRPGWHRWTTPSGRVYEQEPKRYPV